MSKKPLIKVHRFWQDKNQSSGTCVILNEDLFPLFSSLSLERGWQDNKTMVSCVPIGTYKLVKEYSSRFKQDLWELKGVPGRSECKFHAANYWSQLNGCIALGLRAKKINSDTYIDITASGETMKAFHEELTGYSEAILVITGNDGIK
jgi:hypothetical protein